MKTLIAFVCFTTLLTLAGCGKSATYSRSHVADASLDALQTVAQSSNAAGSVDSPTTAPWYLAQAQGQLQSSFGDILSGLSIEGDGVLVMFNDEQGLDSLVDSLTSSGQLFQTQTAGRYVFSFDVVPDAGFPTSHQTAYVYLDLKVTGPFQAQ